MYHPNATKGMCTGPACYISNAEINNIIILNDTVIHEDHKVESDSDIVVYNEPKWVAYMTRDTKDRRCTA